MYRTRARCKGGSTERERDTKTEAQEKETIEERSEKNTQKDKT